MEEVGSMAKAFFDIWKEMLSGFFSVLPTAIFFCLWLLSAIIILPCVYVAGILYPKWVEWGEGF